MECFGEFKRKYKNNLNLKILIIRFIFGLELITSKENIPVIIVDTNSREEVNSSSSRCGYWAPSFNPSGVHSRSSSLDTNEKSSFEEISSVSENADPEI